MGYENGRRLLTNGDLCQAEAAFGRGLSKGDVRCVYGLLKICLAVGNEKGADYFLSQLKERFSELLALAEAKDEHAVFIIGSCYENGWCVPKDAELAIKYYSAVAEKNVLAQYNLGCVLISPPIEDHRAAIPWFERAMRGGDREARFNLGYCYLKLGDEKSLAIAKTIFEQAAADGDQLAETALERYFSNSNL